MKLEVGQFARLKSGYICKIININDLREPNMQYGVEANYLKNVMFIGDDDVVKASYDIIDILEVGDYVNSLKVTSVDKTFEENTLIGLGTNFGFSKFDNDYKITSVVTHEQMEQMAYKVEEYE